MNKKELETLENLLFEAYRQQRASIELPETWRQNVMRKIRKIHQTKGISRTFLEKWLGSPILFRFAGFCLPCALSLALFFVLTGGMAMGFDRLMLGNPMEGLALVVFLL